MHCGCMPWCLLNIKALGCGTELLLGELKEILLFFPILGLEFLFISYFLATVIPIFLFSKCYLSLDTLRKLKNTAMPWLSAQGNTWDIKREHVPVCKEENSKGKTEGFFCIVKVLLVAFAPILSGVILNGMSGSSTIRCDLEWYVWQ